MRRSRVVALGFSTSALALAAACVGSDPLPVDSPIIVYADSGAPNTNDGAQATTEAGADAATSQNDAASESDAGSDASNGQTEAGPPDICPNGTTRCTGAQLETCNGQGWSLTTTCATAALCQARTGATCAPAACNASQTRCSDNLFQQCNATQTAFETKETCSDAAHCLPSGCSEVCSTGQRQCDFGCSSGGGTTADDCIRICNASHTGWDFQINCGISQHDQVSSSCRELTPGSPECY